MYSDYLELLKRGLSEQFDSNQKAFLTNEKSISSTNVRIKEMESENAKYKAEQAKAAPADKIKLDSKIKYNNDMLSRFRIAILSNQMTNEEIVKQNKWIKDRIQKFNTEQGEILKSK
jgi:hypothetical protein